MPELTVKKTKRSRERVARRCPNCKKYTIIQVVDSRTCKDGIRRRRACRQCKYRWRTIEVEWTEFCKLRKQIVLLKNMREFMGGSNA